MVFWGQMVWGAGLGAGALASDQTGLVFAILLLCAFYTYKTPYFLNSTNFSNIGVAISYGGIMAAGFTLVHSELMDGINRLPRPWAPEAQ